MGQTHLKDVCSVAPVSGKTTMAARLFADLKMLGWDVEHIQEYIKARAYEKRFPTSFDQVYVFGNQLHREDRLLHHVNLVVTDSPVLMNLAYARHNGFAGWSGLVEVANHFEQQFPSLNFFLHRRHDFVASGRFEDEENSRKVESVMLDLMRENLPPNRTYLEPMTYEEILLAVAQTVDPPK
jgi:hypothetical protein